MVVECVGVLDTAAHGGTLHTALGGGSGCFVLAHAAPLVATHSSPATVRHAACIVKVDAPWHGYAPVATRRRETTRAMVNVEPSDIPPTQLSPPGKVRTGAHGVIHAQLSFEYPPPW